MERNAEKWAQLEQIAQKIRQNEQKIGKDVLREKYGAAYKKTLHDAHQLFEFLIKDEVLPPGPFPLPKGREDIAKPIVDLVDRWYDLLIDIWRKKRDVTEIRRKVKLMQAEVVKKYEEVIHENGLDEFYDRARSGQVAS